MTHMLVPLQKLNKLVVKKLTNAGLNADHAVTVSKVLTHADLRGVHSHGVLRTEHYVKRLQNGGIIGEPSFSLKITGPSSAIFNGDDGMGHVIAKESMDQAIKLAMENGVGMVTATNSSHCGALSYFVQQATENNLIGIAMTQTDKIVVPFGGSVPFFGTNPIAFGFPAKTHHPIILDMATSNVALGKIIHAKEAGKSIPNDWGIDEKGNATTDPNQVVSLLPFAGPKGYGLGLAVDVLSGILAGAAFGPHITQMYGGNYKEKRKLGHFVCAVNPSVFTDQNEFLSNVDQMIDEIHAVPTTEGFKQVLVPGEPEQLREQESLKKGVSVTEKVYNYLLQD